MEISEELSKLKRRKDGNVYKREILKFLKEDSDRCVIGDKGGISIIACWRTDFYHVSFFCPDCKRIHNHGWGNGKPNGHRIAHCHRLDGRFKKGYYLCYQGTLSEEKW